jgi:glycogen operon protein
LGDEPVRSPRDNDNPYCRDNKTTWFDWSLGTPHADLHRVVQQLIAALMLPERTSADHGLFSLNALLRWGPIDWRGVMRRQPGWNDDHCCFALTVTGGDTVLRHNFMANAWWQSRDPAFPAVEGIGTPWLRWIEAALKAPHDIAARWKEGTPVITHHCRVGERLLVLLSTMLP